MNDYFSTCGKCGCSTVNIIGACATCTAFFSREPMPETVRSPGTPPKPATARRSAWATYEVIRRGVAAVEVTYLGASDLWSGMRVEIRNPDIGANGVDPLYEEAYRAACVAARCHDYEIERFSRIKLGVRTALALADEIGAAS